MSTPVQPSPSGPPASSLTSRGLDYGRLMRRQIVWIVAVLVLFGVVGMVSSAAPGLFGGLIGAAIAGMFGVGFPLVMKASERSAPTTQAMLVVAVWLFVILVGFICLAAVSKTHAISKTVLGLALLVGLLGALFFDVRAILVSRSTLMKNR